MIFFVYWLFGWECIAMVFSRLWSWGEGLWNIAFAAGLFGLLMSQSATRYLVVGC